MSVTIAKVPSDVVATPLHLQVYFQTPAREGHLLQRCRPLGYKLFGVTGFLFGVHGDAEKKH